MKKLLCLTGWFLLICTYSFSQSGLNSDVGFAYSFFKVNETTGNGVPGLNYSGRVNLFEEGDNFAMSLNTDLTIFVDMGNEGVSSGSSPIEFEFAVGPQLNLNQGSIEGNNSFMGIHLGGGYANNSISFLNGSVWKGGTAVRTKGPYVNVGLRWYRLRLGFYTIIGDSATLYGIRLTRRLGD